MVFMYGSNELASRRVLDAGNKACDLFSGPPQLVALPAGGAPLDERLAAVTYGCVWI